MSLLFALLGCTAARLIDLGTLLELRALDSPARVIAGERLQITYLLRNRTSEALNLCSAGGVSMVLHDQSGAKWPLSLHGITTDTACSGPITLGAGEERKFVESGAIRHDWPEGDAVVVASFTVWCPWSRQCVERTLEHRAKVTIEHRDGG